MFIIGEGGGGLSMLISSLDRGSYVLHQQRNLQYLYLCGYVPLLQVSVSFWFHW